MYNHTQGQVSGPMRANTVNKKYTDKQSTKEVLWEEIEGGFISIKMINANRELYPTSTLFTTLLYPAGEANRHVWFVYGSQKI